jgi:hypothetical protein
MSDLLSQIAVGDFLPNEGSLYGVIALNHHTAGSDNIELRHVRMGHEERRWTGDSFPYHKSSFNRDFKRIHSTARDRELSLLASLLVQANASGDISAIHEILIRVNV